MANAECRMPNNDDVRISTGATVAIVVANIAGCVAYVLILKAWCSTYGMNTYATAGGSLRIGMACLFFHIPVVLLVHLVGRILRIPDGIFDHESSDHKRESQREKFEIYFWSDRAVCALYCNVVLGYCIRAALIFSGAMETGSTPPWFLNWFFTPF